MDMYVVHHHLVACISILTCTSPSSSGVMDCVRIRKAGYPVRIPFREFLGAHRALWLDYDRTLLEPIHKLGELKVLCNALITKNKVASEHYQLGKRMLHVT